jgi:hypothetical protein
VIVATLLDLIDILRELVLFNADTVAVPPARAGCDGKTAFGRHDHASFALMSSNRHGGDGLHRRAAIDAITRRADAEHAACECTCHRRFTQRASAGAARRLSCSPCTFPTCA